MATDVVVVDKRVSIPMREIKLRFARSSGPGGQNVNKVESRVELLFDVKNSPSLSEEAKRAVLSKLHSRIDPSGVLRISSQESRSQWRNRVLVLNKFVSLLRWALIPERRRVPTQPTVTSAARRVQEKKAISQKKKLRSRVLPSAD